MDTVFRVADLIAHPGLNTRLIGGAGGVDRAVLWAHTCEMSDPARWLGPDELLMTIGLCVPRGSEAQRAFIARLDDAGLAGIAIGEDGLAPRVTKSMKAEADARGFPILATGHETPFAALGRTVAAANADQRTMGVLMLAKLYQVASERDEADRRSGARLSELLGTSLTVVDDETGCVIIGEGILAPGDWRSYALRTQRPCRLLIDPRAALDSFTLVHLAQVLAVDTDAILNDALQRVRDSASALQGALDRRADGRRELRGIWSGWDVGAGPGAYRAVIAGGSDLSRATLAFALSKLVAATLETGDRVLVIARSTQLAEVRRVLSELDLTAAASGEHRDIADLSGAVEEAMSELGVAMARKEIWREYEGGRVSLLARSLTESVGIVTEVLGELATNDSRYAPLRETLFSFLDNNLGWGPTAQALGIHRQTLVYRLGQVERITGRSVKRTKDVAEFWLARSAWDQFLQEYVGAKTATG